MIKHYLILSCFAFSSCLAYSQSPAKDSAALLTDTGIELDTSIINYDELFNELDLFLDSLLAPRSYFLANVSVTKGYFNFINRANTRIDVVKKNVLSPDLGYFNKTGFGATISGNMISENGRLNLYQFSISPSFDYIKSRKLTAGISYSRYFTKDSIPFYTSPLQNEVNTYFIWRRSWLQPGLNANYGWGNRTEYNKREIIYKRIVANSVRASIIRNIIDTIHVITTNKESIVDFTLAATMRHDFYWLNVFSRKDYIRLTPLVSLTAGTQRFGYNQTTGAYGGITRTNLSLNTKTRDISLAENFKPLSLSLYFRSEYSVGKFFIQPQFIFDYYFPGKQDNLTTYLSFNAGFMF